MDCAVTILAIGRSAQTLRELRDHVAAAPIESIFHHFYESLLRPSFDDREFRNDFAAWARRQLRDIPLAERLGVIDPIDYENPEHLRAHLLDVIEDRLAEEPGSDSAGAGREFHFLRSRFVVVESGLRADTPDELGRAVAASTTGSVFYHFVEARRRHSLRKDDYSAWLEAWGDQTERQRHELAGIDIYLWPLAETRERVIRALAPERPAGERP